MNNIITIGGATIDIFMKSRNFRVAHNCDNIKEGPLLCLGYDKKVLVEDVHFTCGGGGANTAVSFSRLGLKTSFLGQVGQDEMGERIKNRLKQDKVGLDLVLETDKYKSGFSVALHSYARSRTLLLYRGANNFLSKEDIDWGKLKQTKWIYLSHISGASQSLVIELAKFMKKNKKINLGWNPGSTQIKEGLKALTPLLKKTNILFLNKEEASELAGIKIKKGESFDKLFKKLLSAGPEIVVITDGRNGAKAFDGKEVVVASIHEAGDVLDTTGAGDAFASGFTAGFIYTNDIKKALTWGVRQSGAVVTEYGAQNGLLDKKGIEG